MCPSCLFGDTSECPNKHYSGTWTRYDVNTGKRVTDPEFHNKHWSDGENCTKDADISLQLPSVTSPESGPTSPSVTSPVQMGTSDRDFHGNTDVPVDVPVEQDLDTRIAMCQNFGALRDLFSLQEPFDPIECTVAKMCRSHRLDTDALQFTP